MADRWRVGAGGNWDDTAHWSLTQGGATGASTPTYLDNALFDQNSSGTVTVAAAAACRDLDFTRGTGFTGTFAGSSALNIGGSLALNAAMTRTYTGAITFASQNTGKTVTCNGKTLASNIVFNGIGGGWTLQDAFTTTGPITLSAGSLDTNSKATSSTFLIVGGNLPTTLTLGASVVTITNNQNGIAVSATSHTTVNAGTSSIVFSGSQAASSISFGGKTFYDVTIPTTQNAFSDGGTFHNLTITGTTALSTMTLAATITVTGTLTLTGNSSSNRLIISPNNAGQTRTVSAGAVSLTDVDFQDITGAGAATWTGTRLGDRLGNSGITFATPGTKFWVGGTGNTSDATNHWALTSAGGAGVNNYPLPQDEVKWDAASNATAYTVTVNQAFNIDKLNFSAAPGTSGTITWAGSQALTVNGDLVLLTGMTRTYTGAITFAARSGSKSITSNAVTMASATTFADVSASTAIWQLQGNHNIGSSVLTMTSGTLDLNAKNVTCGNFSTNSTNTRTLITSGSTITCTSFNVGAGTGLTLTIDTSSLITGAMAATFAGGGLTYNDLTITGSTASLQISPGNTFRNLTLTPSAAQSILMQGNTTVTGTFTATGSSAANRLAVTSNTAGTARTITAATTALTDVDFQDITAAGAGAWTGTRLGDRTGNAGITLTAGVNKFWVGGTGNWSANKWSLTTGGAAAVNNFPLPQDSVVFDTLSNATAYTVTMDVASFAADFTLGAPLAGNVTWAGSAAMTLYGNMNLSGGASITRTFTGVITFAAIATGKTITMNAVTLASAVTFNGIGGGWTLQDNFTTTGSLTLTAGALVTNGKNTSATTFTSTGSVTRSLDMSGSTMTNSGTWNVAPTGFTLTVNTSSTVSITGDVNFTGGAQTYNDVSYTAAHSPVFLDGNTFRNLTITFTSAAFGTLSFSADQTATGTFTVIGTAANTHPLTVSSIAGTPRTITAAAASLTDVDFRDITGAGAATWTGTRLGDAKGNSGITFATPTNKFWVGNTANWDSTSWALTSGGAAAANNFPLPQDSAIFDANSFSANSQVVTVNAAFRVPALDFSAITKTGITLANGANAITLYGSVTLESHMVITGTGVCTYSGRNTQTITSAGVAWTQTIVINSIGGTVVLADSFVSSATSGNNVLTAGTFDTAGKAVTFAGTFFSNGTATRTLSAGSSIISVGATGTAFNVLATGLTVTANTATIKFTDITSTAKSFSGGGVNFNGASVWFAAGTPSQASPNPGTYTITGSNTFADLKMDVERGTLLTTAGTTTTVNTLTISGVAANNQAFASTTNFASTIAKASGGTVTVDYVAIANSTASPGSTFSDQPHGVDLGGNTNWSFSASTIHASTGVLTGAASTLAGTAHRTREHANTGILTGDASALSGTAHRTREHANTGILTGDASALSGTAHRTRLHASTGALAGAASTLAGTAHRTRLHASTGALAGAAAALAGVSQHLRIHTINGTLIAIGADLNGVAAGTDHGFPSIDRMYTVDAEAREYSVAAEDRMYSVAAEDRNYLVNPEDKNLGVRN